MVKTIFEENLGKLTDELDDYLELTLKIPDSVFTGPSVYFHQEAIKAARDEKLFLEKRHKEMIYAMLPAWGMHHTGNHSVKTVNYKIFENEIKKISGKCDELKHKTILTATDTDVCKIVDLIIELNVSEANTRLVSSSKTLHHILPNLIPPIDRAYSVRFMRQSVFNTNTIQLSSLKSEKNLAKTFIEEMKVFIEKHEVPMKKYVKKTFDSSHPNFNTSLPKLFDNLIVAFIRDKRGDSDEADDAE